MAQRRVRAIDAVEVAVVGELIREAVEADGDRRGAGDGSVAVVAGVGWAADQATTANRQHEGRDAQHSPAISNGYTVR